MSDFNKCPTCHEYDFLSRHKCAPAWEAREFGQGDDWYEVHAYDAESAASVFAEQSDQGGDYDIIRSGSAEIEVRKLGEETIVLVDITAESVPQYYAREREASTFTPPDHLRPGLMEGEGSNPSSDRKDRNSAGRDGLIPSPAAPPTGG